MVLDIKALDLVKHKQEVLTKWVDAKDVEELLYAWQLSKQEFLDNYASGIFDHLISVLQGMQQSGDCPRLVMFMEYLANKIVSVGDIFTICIRFRHILSDVVYENYVTSENFAAYPDLIRTIHNFFDLNLRGALDSYYATLYIKEQEVKGLTQKNRAQEELLVVQSRQAMMGEMIAAIAHQWRQPLNAISIVSQEIGYVCEDNTETQELVASIDQQIKYMDQTINDFKQFFKPVNENDGFFIIEAVEFVLSLVEKQYRKYGISFKVLSGDDVYLSGKRSELVQVLMILFSNARDAIVERGIENGEIVLSIENDNNNLKVCVKDNGGGIPHDVMKRLFVPYSTTKQEGTGIGLYIAKQISQKNGAKLEAHNEGDGAKFCMIFGHTN